MYTDLIRRMYDEEKTNLEATILEMSPSDRDEYIGNSNLSNLVDHYYEGSPLLQEYLKPLFGSN